MSVLAGRRIRASVLAAGLAMAATTDRIVGSGLQGGVSATATAASGDALTFTVVLNP